MFTSVLTIILGATAAGWLLSHLKMLAVFASILVLTNVGTGFFFYLKGHNEAASQCKLNEVVRQRDEARRDLKVSKDTSDRLAAELSRQQKALADGDRRTAEYARQIQEMEAKYEEAIRKADSNRPANCPACPRPRPCVID